MKKLLLTTFGLTMALAVCAETAPTGRNAPWPKEKAWAWYDAQPWIRGCNYMPASCANRADQWQALGAKEHFEEMDRELAVGEKIGFNTMRILVELQGFGIWLADHDGFMERFEKALQILDRHKMRAIVVLGNDCMRPKQIWQLPKPGPQPCDIGYHGGRRLSQHGSFPGEMGYSQVDDPELKPKFYAMCEELLTKYRTDRRILFWNVWNEPGNARRGTASVEPLREMFRLAWRINPDQPLAADVWSGHYGMTEKDQNKAQILAGQLSDIISYHCYRPFEDHVRIVSKLKRHYGRPLVNTEWLARMKHNGVFDNYPMMYLEKIGAVNWGFVAGKYQTYEPWESMWKQLDAGDERAKEYDFTKWFHDLLRPSLRPYDPKEIDLMTRFNKLADDERRPRLEPDGPAEGAWSVEIPAKEFKLKDCQPERVILEAHKAELSGGATCERDSGSAYGRVVRNLRGKGSAATYRFSVPRAGRHRLVVRYACFAPESALTVSVNGTPVGELPCKYLGPEDFADVRTDVELKAGENELSLSVLRGGETKIDVLSVCKVTFREEPERESAQPEQ